MYEKCHNSPSRASQMPGTKKGCASGMFHQLQLAGEKIPENDG
jgi:hypothetical protein